MAAKGESIKYTIGIVPPALKYGTLYTEPIAISEDTQINAISFLPGSKPSPVVSVKYIFNYGKVTKPVINPGSGTYNAVQTVTVSCSDREATILISTGGDYELYTGPTSIRETATISAIAVKQYYSDSDVVKASYIITAPAPTPTPAPAATSNEPTFTPGVITNPPADTYPHVLKQFFELVHDLSGFCF